jgi:hypothetical protein
VSERRRCVQPADTSIRLTLGSSFLINYFGVTFAYRLWCEGCLYSLGEEEMREREMRALANSNVSGDWALR